MSKEHYLYVIFCDTWWSHSSTNILLSASHPKDTRSILWTSFWWQNKHITLPNSDILHFAIPRLSPKWIHMDLWLYVPSLPQFLKIRLPTIMELSFKWNFRLLKLWRFILWSAGLWQGHLLGSNQYLWNMQPTSRSTYRLCCTLWIPTKLTGTYKI